MRRQGGTVNEPFWGTERPGLTLSAAKIRHLA